MKLTVCFGDVRVVVPCGDGDFTVGELIQRAVGRYKKAAGKQKDTDVRVIVLKSLRDGGILDIDDLLSDVVDDRDQVSAEFVELPERLKYDDSVVAYGTVVLRSKEAIQSYGANERPAATRLVGSRRDGSQDAAADDEASSSGPSSGEQDDQDELPVAAVVVTKSDLDKDIGNKQSQLTVRRESEPCKTAVSTAVSQRQPTITDTGNIGQPRPPAPSSQVPRPTKERPSSERYKAPVQLSLSTGEPADDDDDEQTDDDGQGSLPRLQQQPTGGTVEVATGCPAADADKPPAPAATTISRLLSGFARSSARQSLGSSSASRAWTVAQERAETRSAARPESSSAVSAAAASEATASAALQQMPWLTSASARRVPTSLALAPLSAEVGDDDGCPRPATEAAARHLVGAASPEQPKAPLKAAARRLLSSPRKSNDCDNGGRKGGVAGESASDDTVLGRSESDTTKETSKPPSQPGCAVTVKIQGAREHLGFHVAGYFRSGREAGLAIHHLEAGGRMEREGLIAIGDIVQEVNGKSLIGVPLDKAKAMLREALDAGDAVLSIMKYKMTEAGSSSSSLGPMGPCNVKATDSLPASASTGAIAVNLKHPPQPPMRSPSTRLSSAALQNATATEWAIDPPRLIGFDELTVDLVKGAEGLGFTISSREHLAAFNGGVAPVFVKTIMPFGAAIADGRLKCGDRLMHVNGDDVSCRTQDDIVVLLRSTKQGSTVRIRVLRQHAMLDAPPLRTPSSAAGSPGSPADPTYENVLVKVGDPSFDYGDIMTFDIPSAGIMPGTLGISIKGETALLAEGIRDLGVFIKDIVAGGAAHLDGRLRPGDLLLSVNGTKLQGLSNAAAMAVLRRAANECRTACSVTVARRQQPMGVESEQKQRPQSIQLLQANRVGDKGVSAALQMEVPEPKASRQLELRLPSQAAADRLSSPLPVTDRVTAHVSAASDAGATTYDKEPHVELVHEEQGSEPGRLPLSPSSSSSLPAAPLPLPASAAGDRPSRLALANVSGSGVGCPAPATLGRPSDLAADHVIIPAADEYPSVLAAAFRPTPVPRKGAGSAVQSRLRQCSAATSPVRCDHTCGAADFGCFGGGAVASDRATGGGGSSSSPGCSDSSVCAACQLQWRQLSPEPLPCSPPLPGSTCDGSEPSPAATAATAAPLSGSGQEPALRVNDDDMLPAGGGFSNDGPDAAAAALELASPSSVDKVDAAIQCEAATSSSGSLGRGRWEQRFHRSQGGGAGLRRSAPRSQVSDVEKKERRKSELLLSSPYPNLVTLVAAAAGTDAAAPSSSSSSSLSSPPTRRDPEPGGGGDLARKARDEKPADLSGSGGGAASLAAATLAGVSPAAVSAAGDARHPSPSRLGQGRDFGRDFGGPRRPERSSSAYAASSPVSAWVERTLEHARSQPPASALLPPPPQPPSVGGSRLPVFRSPSFIAAVPDMAAAELSWEEDDFGIQRPVAAAPNGREKAFVQRRALSVESLDSHGSGSVSQQSRSKFSSLESLKAEMRDPYELSGEPQKARRRVARGCNESFRAAVDHSYDAPEAFFRHVGAQGSKFDEVHDSGINPLSSSSSSSDQFLEVGDRKQPAVALAAKESSTKGTKKDKTKASAFFGHLFRIGKSRKSIEDRQKGPFVKRPGGGSGSGRQDELVDGPAEWKTERARVGSSTSQVQLRLQRNQQHQGSWSYHGSSVQGGTAVVAPSAMNEYYHRLMEDQRLQMVLASAISNDPINQAADHVYVNWTIPSSYGSNKKPHALPQQGTAGAVSPSAMAPAELGYSKVKAKQKSEPDLAKHRVVPPPAVPLHRDNLWSDRIYHRSERDLPESIRATSTASDWRSHQQPMGVVSSGHRHKKAGPTATGPVSARRPLSLHDDTDALLMAAHRRAAAANDYDNLPAVNFAAAATQTHPKLAAEPTAHRRLTTATARAAPSRTSDGRRAGGGGGAPPASGRSVGSSARPTNRLSWCYDYSGSSSSDDYSYGKAAGNAYTSAPQGARKQAEAARV